MDTMFNSETSYTSSYTGNVSTNHHFSFLSSTSQSSITGNTHLLQYSNQQQHNTKTIEQIVTLLYCHQLHFRNKKAIYSIEQHFISSLYCQGYCYNRIVELVPSAIPVSYKHQESSNRSNLQSSIDYLFRIRPIQQNRFATNSIGLNNKLVFLPFSDPFYTSFGGTILTIR